MVNPSLDYIGNNFTNKKLKKIVNVYQTQYFNHVSVGFGDFLRGSFYLTNICNVLGLEFDIDLKNHPMFKFLKISNSSYNFCQSSVEAFMDSDICNLDEGIRKNFIDKLNNFNGEIYYLFCNFKMLFHIDNQNCNIPCARNTIIPKIEIKEDILNILDKKLQSCNLTRNNYAVIHIRCGDYFMNPNWISCDVMSMKRVNVIINTLNKKCNNNQKYILIGDSNKIKQDVSSKCPNIVIFDTQITHLGANNQDNDNAILETLIDFNIIRFSNFIISFSVYSHGSNFSNYCSQIYDIPFKQIII